MIRHLSFKSSEDFKNYILSNVPAHLYYSSAYYEYPDKEMEEKNWLKADLIFDIDSDHLPIKAPQERLLEIAKKEVKKLITILKKDFGVNTEDIKVYFSGSRGYHIHVLSEEYSYLSSAERKEIIDYITLVNPKILNGEKFHRSNVARRVEKYIRKKLNVKSEKIPKKYMKEIKGLIEDALNKMRIPGSLHGKTGLKVTEIEDLDKFNPLRDSIVFSDELVEVTILKNVKISIGDFKSKLHAGDRVKIPEYAAIFLLCRGDARFG